MKEEIREGIREREEEVSLRVKKGERDRSKEGRGEREERGVRRGTEERG